MNLSDYIDRQHESICKFRDEHPDIWVIVDGAFLVSHTMAKEVTQLSNNFQFHETLLLQFWRTTLDYLMESFTLIVKKNFDLGLGCLRLASELVRNSLRIFEKPELVKLISANGEESSKRKAFKFDLSKPDEEYLFSLYNLCSTYGIHGHVTSDINRKPMLFHEDYVIVEIKPIEVLKMLEIWLKSFFPLMNQYVYYFSRKYRLESGRNYAEMHEAFNNALTSFEKNLKEMIANESN